MEATTVGQRGWKGVENGELLRRAEVEFDVFITTDHGIPHQQNLADVGLAIVILRARSNRFVDLRPLMEGGNRRIRELEDGDVIEVAP